MPSSKPHRRAVTLVEAIIALVVVSVAAPPMMLAVRDSSVRRVDPILADRARWLAGEKLEDLIADRHSTARGYAYLASTNYPAEPAITGFSNFARSVTIAETGASLSGTGTGYKRVTVTVTWRDYRGTGRSLALSTIITAY